MHAIRVLENKRDFTLDSLMAAAYDSYLPWFAVAIPSLTKAWDRTVDSNPLKAKVAPQIAVLRAWDYRWGVDSVATSLAVFYGEELVRKQGVRNRRYMVTEQELAGVSTDKQLEALAAASAKLEADFGSWKTAWGDINRFQRLTDDIVHPFRDDGPSIPVAFTSATWGSLASFGARAYPQTKKWYGTSGNSFVAVVEFAPEGVRAKAVTAGGESGAPQSKHFNDQAKRYAEGALREVYYYPAQLKDHTERTYRPGE